MSECVVPGGALLGESPVWSVAQQVLYWVDIDGRAVHAFDPSSGEDRTWPMMGRPTALALTADPSQLLVAVENGLGRLDLVSGEFAPWVTLEESREGIRLNDGRCDPVGRFWVGGMFVPSSAGRFEARLHCVEGDGTFVTTRDNVGIANGLAFSPDGTVMYWADTLHEKVWAYDYDAATGEPRHERVFLDFTSLPGRPDGACVDEDGCYWVACLGASMVMRVTSQGVVDREIPIPVPRPTMPAFGGTDLGTMYVTSIGPRPGDGEIPGQAGGLYAFRPGMHGIPEPIFAG